MIEKHLLERPTSLFRVLPIDVDAGRVSIFVL